MKKSLRFIIFLALTLLALATLASCFGGDSEQLTAESIFAMAQENGYTGTLEEFMAEFRGEQGTGIESVSVNAENHLIVVLSDGTSLDCGVITVANGKDGIDGKDGADGKDGKNGSLVQIGANGNWYIDGSDTGVPSKGTAGQKGDTGATGAPGKNGIDGSQWLSGSGAPSALLGRNSDLYLDTDSYDVYQKTDDTWMRIANFSDAANGGDASTEITTESVAKAIFSTVLIQCFKGVEYASSGSGVIYQLDKENGNAYIVTNFHVIYDSATASPYNLIAAYIFGNEADTMVCEYVGGSMKEDLAVLKITGAEVLKTSNAAAAELESSSSVSVSDPVVVAGNAEGLGMSATHGRVSVNVETIPMTGADGVTSIKLQCIRVDAAVNHGNSGGGLFDKNGRLIGVINAKMENFNGQSIDNIGFAIPIDKAVAIADSIIASCDGITLTSPSRLTLGIGIEAKPNGADFNPASGKIEKFEKITVTSVSGISVGKLETGDIITKITVGEREYKIDRYYQLQAVLYSVRAGDTVTVSVIRQGVANNAVYTVASGDFGLVM